MSVLTSSVTRDESNWTVGAVRREVLTFDCPTRSGDTFFLNNHPSTLLTPNRFLRVNRTMRAAAFS